MTIHDGFVKNQRPHLRLFGNRLMIKNKTNCILFSLLLAFGIFANNSLSNVCFCGQTCEHGAKTRLKGFTLFHLKCTGSMCKSCDLEKGKTKISTISGPASVKAKILYAALTPAILQIYSDAFPSFNHNQCDFINTTIPYPPIYLQKSSWLC